MKINNTTQIRTDDFDKEMSTTIEKLGNILNPFMQQVVELADGRMDFENRVENFIQVEMTVDVNGKPILNNKVNTGKSNIRGLQVIAAYNQTNTGVYATQQPFISFQAVSGGIIQINNITGLQENNKYLLNIIIY